MNAVSSVYLFAASLVALLIPFIFGIWLRQRLKTGPAEAYLDLIAVMGIAVTFCSVLLLGAGIGAFVKAFVVPYFIAFFFGLLLREQTQTGDEAQPEFAVEPEDDTRAGTEAEATVDPEVDVEDL
jgi:hypothetical protein